MPPPLSSDEFSRKLREAFAVEAEEHWQTISAGLLILEKRPAGSRLEETVEQIFREAHSLKGAARAVNRTDIETVCQGLEGVFMSWKREPPRLSPSAFDTLNRAVNLLAQQFALPEPAATARARQEVRDMAALLRALEAGAENEAPPPAATPHSSIPPSSRPAPATPVHDPLERGHGAETVRVPVERMSALLRKAEGLIAVKLAAQRYLGEIETIGSMLELWRHEWQKAQRRTPAATPGSSPGGAELYDWSQAHLQAVEDRVAALARGVQQDERAVATMVDDLLDDAKKLVMLPLATLLDVFPKLVRDLSREQGKEIEVTLRGREVEMDKRILDELKDPLLHLVRNSVDHGLEKPDVRIAARKPATGALAISVFRLEGSKIAVEVSDDGVGIDAAKVVAAAIRQGAIAPREAAQLSPEAARALIFESGVSTSPIITEISGRGLGMAIVREKVEKLGGQVAIASLPGQGATFRLVLPVKLATFKGILVAAGGQRFVAPNAAVEQIARVRREDLTMVENRPALRFNGRLLAVASLVDLLELPPSPSAAPAEFLEVVVLSAAQSRLALVVDEILNEQEVLVKPLNRPLVRVRNIASAALLGSGTPALILHVGDLLQSAAHASSPAQVHPGTAATPVERRLLVADDSVTSRMLLKNILEAAGYEVVTAIDGMEAWTCLQAAPFDLLVTDGEMPRLNGFELTSKVRADRKLNELPVVVVTALGSREDRERGIDAGANAYIVKSSFDQSNLLDIIRKLIA